MVNAEIISKPPHALLPSCATLWKTQALWFSRDYLFNGLLQLVGVTSIFPFFALAADLERIQNSKNGSWYAITLGGVLLYSVAIWWLFERNTNRVRKGLKNSIAQ
jgi:hypothetical protein